jgi:hypothetical protein
MRHVERLELAEIILGVDKAAGDVVAVAVAVQQSRIVLRLGMPMG